MQKTIEDISSNELLTALESNMAAFWSTYGRGRGCTLQATSDVVWFYTGIQDPLFNGVLSTKLDPSGVQRTLDSLQAKIDVGGAPAFWWIGPQSKPENIGTLLQGHGLQLAGEVPGMAMDLAMVDEELDLITGFSIQSVNNAELQALWARIAAVGSGFSDSAAEAMVKVETSLTDPEYKAQHRYIGFLHGTPVASAAMVLDSGVAGIYAVATIPEARRKGIGRLMTVLPLLEARQSGYRVGILQASSMGYPIYKKIGFQDVCKFRIYLQS
jgi:hypothetical protein